VPATARAGSVRSKYAFIRAHREEFPTEVMSRVLGVAPSGYYEWLQRPQRALIPALACPGATSEHRDGGVPLRRLCSR